MNGPSPCRFRSRSDRIGGMEQQTVRKTYKYKLKPTPEQEQAMAFVLRRCRELYNAALQERKEAWQQVRCEHH